MSHRRIFPNPWQIRGIQIIPIMLRPTAVSSRWPNNMGIPGIHVGSLNNARRWKEEGMRLIGFNTDIKFIQRLRGNTPES